MSLAEIDASPGWDPAAPARVPVPGRPAGPGTGRSGSTAALARARLVAVPTTVTDAAPARRRLPFVVTLAALLTLGLGGLLGLNTVMAQDSVRAARLAEQAATLDAQRQALAEQQARLRSPESLAAAAAAQGLRPQTAPPILDLRSGTVTDDR